MVEDTSYKTASESTETRYLMVTGGKIATVTTAFLALKMTKQQKVSPEERECFGLE